MRRLIKYILLFSFLLIFTFCKENTKETENTDEEDTPTEEEMALVIKSDDIEREEIRVEDPSIMGYMLEGVEIRFIFNEKYYKDQLRGKAPSKVNVAGEFNNWAPNDADWQLIRTNDDGLWELIKHKEQCGKGIVPFKFTYDGAFYLQPPKDAVNTQESDDPLIGRNLLLLLD